MAGRDPRVDAYIEKSADFAKPILRHLRELVHTACPEVEETMRWSFPHFTYHGLLCSMASFKRHCAFGLWKGSLILGEQVPEPEAAMGHFGRITSLEDLPPDGVLIGYLREGMRLNQEGIQPPSRVKRAPKPEITLPDDLVLALREHPLAGESFAAFSPSHRREYVEWISGAKSDATRARRLATAIEWMAEGKSRNWKYDKK